MKIQMGNRYFKLDNTVETQEPLLQLFLDFGFEKVIQSTKELEELGLPELFTRKHTFTNNDGLTFTIIWFKNLCTFRVGEWGKAFTDILFDEIVGSYGPCSEHEALDLKHRGETVCKIAISNKEE